MKHEPSYSVLVADDDQVALDLMGEVLAAEGYTVFAASGGEEAVSIARRISPDAALIDFKMPDQDGLWVLNELRALHPGIPVIIVTAFADMDTTLAAIGAGAHDFLSKPFRMEEIKAVMNRIAKARPVEMEVGASQAPDNHSGLQNLLVGSSPSMIAVYKMVARVANLSSTVLITGETGTGKEQVARAIHSASDRSSEPFNVVDCTALPASLFESEVFGHEKGSFTGAHAARAGILEDARHGTCFFDEVGELARPLQAKLLRALQERTVRRVGGNKPIPFHARIVAATNRDLWQMVQSKEFREDLFYRLNVINLALPALRDRREDIPLLADHFLRKHAAKNERSVPILAPETTNLLRTYDWPGNVRQMENVIERAVALSASPVILPEDLPREISGVNEAEKDPADDSLSLRKLTRSHVVAVLKSVDGNKLRAAQILGINRRTIYRMLDEGSTD